MGVTMVNLVGTTGSTGIGGTGLEVNSKLKDTFWRLTTLIYKGERVSDEMRVSMRGENVMDGERLPYVPDTVRRPTLLGHERLRRTVEADLEVDTTEASPLNVRAALRRAAERAADGMTVTGLVSPEVAGLVAIDMAEAIVYEMPVDLHGEGSLQLGAAFAVYLAEAMTERYREMGYSS